MSCPMWSSLIAITVASSFNNKETLSLGMGHAETLDRHLKPAVAPICVDYYYVPTHL